MFSLILFAILPIQYSYAGPPQINPAPTTIVVGQPDLSDPTMVTIKFTVTNPSCCDPTQFLIPGFDPIWGTYQGVSIGTDLEVNWFGGVEYLDCPFYSVGRCVYGWYPPNHGDKLWPDRDDLLNETSDNHWQIETYIQNMDGYHIMAGSKSYGAIGYCYNDNVVHPRTPADLVVDYAGISGGNHKDYDPKDLLVYGPTLPINVMSNTVRIHLDPDAWIAFTVYTIWTTQIMGSSDTIVHGEVRYFRS